MNDYMKFSRRPGTINFGTTFETMTTASLLLNLTLDENVRNFRLTSNDADFGNFDDIVVEVELLNGCVNKYALQVKYSSDDRQLRKNPLLSSRGNFSIQNYFKYFLQMPEFTKCYNLILFTNLKLYFKEGQMLNLEDSNISLGIREENLPSEFGDGFCYRFYPTVEVSSQHRKFFERFCIYSNHLNIRKIENNLLARFDAKFSCNNVDNYLKFISEWSNKTGRVKRLDKRYMKEIITLQILRTSIKLLPYVENKNNNVTLLKKAISNFNLTVVDTIYFEQVKMIWENEPATPGKIEKIINELYLKNLSENEKRAIALWIMNKCPLIVTESDTVLKAINFCHEKKFILLKSTLISEIRPNLHNIFTKLSALKKFDLTLYQKIAKTFQCSIQGKRTITLEDLIKENQQFENIITVNELMQMLTQPLSIGLQETVSDIYIERAVSRIVISYNFFDEIDTDTLVVISCGGRINKLKNRLKNVNFIDVENEEPACDKLDQANVEKTVYISQYQCSQEMFEDICRRNGRKKNCHHFKLCEDELLEWIYSKGDINDLQKYKNDLYFAKEEDLINHELQHGVNIITGNPGMGKTQLMKKHTFSYPPSVWTIFVSARMWSEYLKNNNKEEIFTHYLMRNTCKSNFEQDVFRIMYDARSIIFFWDGLDELSNTELDSAIETIKDINRNNFKQWISSPKHLKNKLEKIFNTFSRTTAPFNKDQQSAYIQKRLITTEIDLENVIQKIQHYINVQSNEILGVPLQIFMFTELFLNSPKNIDILSNDLFPVTELYKHFIEMKIQIYITDKGHLQEFNVVIKELIKVFRRECLKYHQKAALITVIEENFLQELNIDTDLDISDEESFYRLGLITRRTSEGKFKFVHQSYAEYFASLYLFEHRNKLKMLIKKFIFQNNYRNIRFMFDLLLAKDCPAHLAVLYNNFEYLKSCEDYTRKDKGGRNPLQIACSWGPRYPLLKNGQENDNDLKNLINISDTPHYEEMLNLLLKYNDIKEKDLLFSIDSIQYADLSLSFKAITILLQHESFSFDILNNFSDLNTVLYYSIKFDYGNVLEFINTQFLTQKTALHMASMSNSISCAQILLNQNHLLHINDTQNLYGETPVFLASQYGHHKMVYLLVKSGADINIPRNDGSTPLHAAASNGHIHVVRFLIYISWNLDAKTNKGCTPIYLATENGHYEIVKYLAEMGADVNIPQQDCFVPIHVAAGNGHLELVILLTDMKSDVNATSKTGTTPIYLAAQEGHCEVIKCLAKSGADVNISQRNGFLPIHVASVNGHCKAVEYLIDLNCDINAQSNEGFTPVYLAAQRGHYEIVKLLVMLGGNINIPQKDGFVPVHIAARNGYVEIVKFLAHVGGDINAKSNKEFTPIYLAVQGGHYDVVKCLIELGADVNISQQDGYIPLHAAAARGDIEIVKLLTDFKIDVNSRSNKGITPIYLAAQKGHLDVIKYLVKSKADVNIPQQDGFLPIHIAAQKGHIRVIERMIELKCDINAKTNKGYTPIYLAAQKGHYAIVKYLAESGSDVNIVQQGGHAPIHAAATNGHSELVNLLTKLESDSVKCNKSCTPTDVGIQVKKLNTYAALDEMVQFMLSMEKKPS